jgi:tetratricopeptide (TPR) repeat protein
VKDVRRFYEIFNLAPGASPEKIKQAYRDLVKAWHPDRFANDPWLQRKAEERLKELNEAYEQLRQVPPSMQAEAFSATQFDPFRPSSSRGARKLMVALIGGIIAWPFLMMFFSGSLSRTEKLYKDVGSETEFAPIAADENVSIQELRAKAVTFYSAKEYRKALFYFEKVLAKSPNHVKTWYQVGKSNFKLGNYYRAVHALQEVIRLKPRYAKAHYSLGRAYTKQRKFDLAVVALQDAIRHNPRYVEGYRELGLLYAKLGRFQDSIGALKQAIQLRPTDSDLYYSFLRVYFRIGNGAE